MHPKTMNDLLDDITGLLLVGGKSRRMGRDKAFLEIAGKPIFERVLEAFRECFPETILVGDRQERFERYHLPIYHDIYQGNALGGLYTGLFHAKTEYVLVAPCDLPFPNVWLMRYLCSLAQGYDVVVPTLAQGYEPLFALYSKSCLKPIQEQLERGDFCVFGFYPQVRVRPVTASELAVFDPAGSTFLNLNTPEEFEKASQMADCARSGSRSTP